MKKHIFSIILMVLAVMAFTLRFWISECWHNYCDIAAFALPMLAAVAELVVSERCEKKRNEQIRNLEAKQLSVRVEDETLIINQGE